MSGFSGIEVSEHTLAQARQCDAAAIAEICRVFATPVHTLACRLLQCRASADDIAQETFEQLMQGLANFRGDASLATWVRRIAVSRCLMHQRSAWQRKSSALDDLPEMPAVQLSPESEAALHGDLESALASLPVTSRTVVWLYDVEGYTHREIAKMTGRSVSFSKSCLSRAHARLRQILGDPDLAPEDQRRKRRQPTALPGSTPLMLETVS